MARCGLRNPPALLSDAAWHILSGTELKVRFPCRRKPADSCWWLSLSPLRGHLKKSDTSRDLPSELRCQNKNGTKSLFGRSPPARREAARSSSAEAQKRWPARREGRPERTLSGTPNLNVWPASWTSRDKNDQETSEGRVFASFSSLLLGKKKEAPAVKVIKPFRVGSNNSKNKRSQKLSSEAPVFSHERVNLLKQNQVRAAPCFFFRQAYF